MNIQIAKLASSARKTGRGDTQTDRYALVRQIGLTPIKQMAQALNDEMQRQRRIVWDRAQRGERRGRDHARVNRSVFFGVPGSVIPRAIWNTPIEERLANHVRALIPRVMRWGAAGGSTYTVRLTTDPSKVGYEVKVEENRDTYKGQYKGWAAREDHHTVTVPRAWMSRVHHWGLGVVDGLLTLDAHLVHDRDGVLVYAAVWAAQGRGYAVTNTRGYIARSGRHNYHAETVAAALAGVARKARAAVAVTAPASLENLAKRHGSVWVSLAHMRAVGACDYGVRAWCARAGMEAAYDAGGATVAQLAPAYCQHPAPELRAAVLHAVRAQRQIAA